MACDVYGSDLTGGETVSALTEYSPTYDAEKAIDDITSTYWASEASPSLPHWWQVQFGSAKYIEKLTIRSYTAGACIEAFTLKASNTGSFSGEEVDLVSDSGLSFGANEVKTWTFDNTNSYIYYRIHITAIEGETLVQINEVEMMECADIAGISADDIGLNDQVDGYKFTDDFSDGIGLSDIITSAGGSTFATAPDGVGLNDQVIVNIEPLLQPISDGIGFADSIDASIFPGRFIDSFSMNDMVQAAFEYLDDAEDALGIADQVDGLNWTQWLRENRDKSIRRYFFTLTGSADAKSDIEIPIYSFQARKRTGYETYANITIKGFTYSTYITNRSNGQMVIELGYEIDGTIELREEILRVDLEKIDLFEGARRKSIQLTGYRTQTFENQISILENPNYRSTENGRILYRFSQVDPFVNPGDTCRVESDEFTIDYITYVVSESYRMMEIREIG